MKPDFCSLCENIRIIGYDEDNRPYELPNYREHFMELSNGSLLKVGLDENCHIGLISGNKVKQNAEKMLESYKAWLRAIPGQPSDFEELEVVKPNTNELDFQMDRIRKQNEEAAKLDEQKESHYRGIEANEPKRLEEEKARREKRATAIKEAEEQGLVSKERADQFRKEEKTKATARAVIFG